MDSFIAIVLAILAICMLVLIAIYNDMDRRRFRLDRMLKGAWPALNDWVEACEELRPGCAAEYRKAKQNWKRTACLQDMVTQVPENSEEKLDIHASEDLPNLLEEQKGCLFCDRCPMRMGKCANNVPGNYCGSG